MSYTVAKMTVRCALYMCALIFSRVREYAHASAEIFNGFCSDRSYECSYKEVRSFTRS